MSVFEHLMTLGSFVLALGLATIVTFVATLVHRRGEAILSTPHMLWMASIFINQINFWLGSYAFHDIPNTGYATIGFVVLFPILLYLQSALVVTDQAASLDLPAHHARNKRAYVGLVLAATLLDTGYFIGTWLSNPIFDLPMFLAAEAVLIASCLLALFSESRAVQIAAPAVVLAVRGFGFFLASHPLLAG